MLSFLANQQLKLLVPDSHVLSMKPSSNGDWLGILSPAVVTIWSLRRDTEFRLVCQLDLRSLPQEGIGSFTCFAWHAAKIVIATDTGAILVCAVVETAEDGSPMSIDIQATVTLQVIVQLPTVPKWVVVTDKYYILVDPSGMIYQLNATDVKEEPRIHSLKDRSVSTVCVAGDVLVIVTLNTVDGFAADSDYSECLWSIAVDADITAADVFGEQLALATSRGEVVFHTLGDTKPVWTVKLKDVCHGTVPVAANSIQWSLGPANVIIVTVDQGMCIVDPAHRSCVFLEATEAYCIGFIDPVSCTVLAVPSARRNVLDVKPLAVAPYLIQKTNQASPHLLFTRNALYMSHANPYLIPYPDDYVLDNGSVSLVAESPDRKYIVICAGRGFALFNRRSSKWQLFPNIEEERMMGKVGCLSLSDTHVAIWTSNSELMVWRLDSALSLSTAMRLTDASSPVSMAWNGGMVITMFIDSTGLECNVFSTESGSIIKQTSSRIDYSVSSAVIKALTWIVGSEVKCVTLDTFGRIAVDGCSLSGSFSDVFIVNSTNASEVVSPLVPDMGDFTTAIKSPSTCPVCPSLCAPADATQPVLSSDCSALFALRGQELTCYSSTLEQVVKIQIECWPIHLDLAYATCVEAVAPLRLARTPIASEILLSSLHRGDEVSITSNQHLLRLLKGRTDWLPFLGLLFETALSRAAIVIKHLPLGMKTEEDVISCTRRIVHAAAARRIASLMFVVRLVHEESGSNLISIVSSSLRVIDPDVTHRMTECFLRKSPNDMFMKLLQSEKLKDASLLLLLIQQTIGLERVRIDFAIPLFNSCLTSRLFPLACELLRFIAVHTSVDDVVLECIVSRLDKQDLLGFSERVVAIADFLPSVALNRQESWDSLMSRLSDISKTNHLASIALARISALVV